MEELGRQGRTLFVNDSKATNADSTEKALVSFPGDIYWILGGKPKAGGIASLAEHFQRVAKAYLIGEATEEFAATLDGQVPFERCGTLEAATAAAARDAAAASAARAGRAAVAGLRLVRPVPQFRGARRSLPRARRRAARHRHEAGRRMTTSPSVLRTHFSLPLDGGGLGWGWCSTSDVVDTPLPGPPPQGGRES